MIFSCAICERLFRYFAAQLVETVENEQNKYEKGNGNGARVSYNVQFSLLIFSFLCNKENVNDCLIPVQIFVLERQAFQI